MSERYTNLPDHLAADREAGWTARITSGWLDFPDASSSDADVVIVGDYSTLREIARWTG